MITLGFIAYVLLSLRLSWDKYNEVEINYLTGQNMNECYRDTKRSLLFGFTIISLATLCLLLCVALLFGVLYVLSKSIVWIINNMP